MNSLENIANPFVGVIFFCNIQVIIPITKFPSKKPEAVVIPVGSIKLPIHTKIAERNEIIKNNTYILLTHCPETRTKIPAVHQFLLGYNPAEVFKNGPVHSLPLWTLMILHFDC